MTQFSYIAISSGGEKISGAVEAIDRSIVLEQIRAQGHLPVDVQECAAGSNAAPGGRRGGRSLFSARASKADVTLFTRELAMLLKAGLTLDHALSLLTTVTGSSRLVPVVAEMRKSLNDGKSLEQALELQGDIFPTSFINMVRVAEASGTLETVLDRLASAREREQKLKSKIISAMVYPGFLVFIAIGTVGIMLGFVIPRFKEIIDNSSSEVPDAAQFVFSASDWLIANAMNVAIGCFAFVLATILAFRLTPVRSAFGRAMTHVPLLGQLYRLNFTIKFCRSLGTLLENGVDLPEALRLSQDVAGNGNAADVIKDANECLRKGEDFTQPLAASGLFCPVAVNLLKVGMETGSIAPSSLYMADMFEEKLDTAMQRTFTILEPVIILLVSGFVAGIIISIIGAVISVNEIVI